MKFCSHLVDFIYRRLLERDSLAREFRIQCVLYNALTYYRYSDSSFGSEQSDLSGNRSQDSMKRNRVLTNSTFYDSEFRATEFRSCGIAVVIRGSEAEIKALEKDRRENVG
jgi:hypothetical protein